MYLWEVTVVNLAEFGWGGGILFRGTVPAASVRNGRRKGE